jgi:alpha-tubulin suppressor-like RCC1 family protein
MKRTLVLLVAALAVLAVGQLPAAATTTPITGMRSVVAGGAHSCARSANGQVRCWGYNSDGELGGGAVGHSSRAVLVQNTTGTGPLTGVTQLSASYTGSCALLANRRVVCWGGNGQGQRGVGTSAAQGVQPTLVRNPTNTGPLTGVESIASSSGDFVCAVLVNGQARCWGDNGSGQLGRGTVTDKETLPGVVRAVGGAGPLTGITSLSLGSRHACARLDNGQVRCWGDNGWGQLGDGTETDRSRPVPVRPPAGAGALTGVASVGLGDTHSCAVLTSGQARCWGDNADGQVGDGTGDDRRRPVAVRTVSGAGALTGVVAIDGGLDHTCARVTGGQVRCWGTDSDGELGNGPGGASGRPVVVRAVSGAGPLTGVTALGSGDHHTCALVSGGGVRCWGSDQYGEAGDGFDGVDRHRPVVVVRS